MKKCIVVNVKFEKCDVYIGRGSKWGNPFKMKNSSDSERNRVCDLYEEYFWKSKLPAYLPELYGKKLGCYCKPKRCHGDFLAEKANELLEKGYLVMPNGTKIKLVKEALK